MLMLSIKFRKFLFSLSLFLLAAGGVIAVWKAVASPAERPELQASPLHPTFVLLDEAGESVLESGNPVSTMRTCGQCHDTAFIASHSFHSDLGLKDLKTPGQTGSGRPWDISPGLFGRWDPLTYRYLSPAGDKRLDLGTADWIKVFAGRIVGGGPTITSREGIPLTELVSQTGDPETTAVDPTTGQPLPWDWQESGGVEMNCFLCHLTFPDNQARIQTLQAGHFRWASTATLNGTGIVTRAADSWAWNRDAFDDSGALKPEFVTIQDPTNQNCGQCHNVVHMELEEPLVLTSCDLQAWQTATTGQVISPQKIFNSGMNLSGKDQLTRSWDIHAERGLECTDCHFSLNNPIYFQANEESRPDHLAFDPRRLEIGEYLQRPVHQFARGQSAQFTIAPELKSTMRRCESCHEAVKTHSWLPYAGRHMEKVACETCHIPQIYAPAVQQVDWTVLKVDGEPVRICRGVEGSTGTINDLITGFQPVLLSRKNVDSGKLLAPYNLVTSWYWTYQDTNGNTRPVRLADLQVAWLENGRYPEEILRVFDQDKNGRLEETELVLDTSEKQALIARRLENLGLNNPEIRGEVQPYSLNHNVTRGEWVIEDCQACHNDASRLTQPIKLANYIPGGILPEFVQDANTSAGGSLVEQDGALYYQPAIRDQKLYVFGHSRVAWVDWIGAAMFIGVLVGVFAHGGLRFYQAVRAPRPKTRIQKVYMYAVYERFWHWLQTFTIVLLLFTGLIIHRPDIFGFFSFRYVVIVHNVLAAILVVNAAMSLFYHLASGEIRQFIPRPYGFFDQAILQAKYYLQGIFKQEPHPFEKTPEKKLNPLQQATYFMILNVLLPLQVVTGALMWGVQHWPKGANMLGGLPFLAPFHSLVAWTFGAFIVGHVYLTTTGHAPLASIKAMMLGWDEIEIHEENPEEENKDDHPGENQEAQPESSPA